MQLSFHVHEINCKKLRHFVEVLVQKETFCEIKKEKKKKIAKRKLFIGLTIIVTSNKTRFVMKQIIKSVIILKKKPIKVTFLAPSWIHF